MTGDGPASRGVRVRAALGGVVAAALALAVATLVASVMDPAAGPLLASMGVVALLLAMVAGLVALRDPSTAWRWSR